MNREADGGRHPGRRDTSGNARRGTAAGFDGLCRDSLALLEALCVLDGAQPRSILARVASIPAPAQAFDKLFDLGFVVPANSPRHPGWIALAREDDRLLVRARLTPTRWRALHRAAADALEPPGALTHRAAAADRPDAALAAELEHAASAAHARPGEVGTPSRQLLVWAADLSVERAERERRLLLAAMHEVYDADSGDSGDGTLWDRVETLPPSPLRYCALAGRALLDERVQDAAELLDAAGRARDAGHRDTDPAADSRDSRVVGAIETVRAALACRLARGRDATQAASRALAAGGGDAVQAREARRLLLTGRSYADGPRSALRAGAQTATSAATSSDTRGDSRLLLLRGECRMLTGDLEAGAEDLEGLALHYAAQPGHPDRLRALERLVVAHFSLGGWQQADSALAELVRSGRSAAGHLHMMLAAVRGTGPAPRRQAWAVRTMPLSAEPDRIVLAAYADAVALAAHRRYPDVVALIELLTGGSAAVGDAPAKFAPLWLPVYAEAVIESETGAAAEAVLARLWRFAEQNVSLQVTYHRLAGRAAEQRRRPTAAGSEYEAGLLTAGACPQLPPLHRAQLEHAYGRLLCAVGQTAAGLGWFQRALDGFASLGALAYLRHCAQDQAAAGWRAPPRDDVALTEQEVTVAGLVASGLTNRQVADELLISSKTVEYHLGKIFRKLGLRSRRELASRWLD